MKGLILCAGRGTRLYPFTISFPKTLIPVANIPLLHSCIEKLIEQNITEIGIVIHPGQESSIKQSIKKMSHLNIEITYIYQHAPSGIANAILQAKDFIGQDSFILLLGDNLISISLTDLKEQVDKQGNDASLLLTEVDNPREYGIAEVAGSKIIKLEEKPQQPKSNLAVLGAYAFSPSIMKATEKIKPSARGEYEITDAIQWMIENGYSVAFHKSEEPSIDVGTLERWIGANRKMLEELSSENDIHPTAIIKNSKIISPVSIDGGTVIENAVIGPYVSIGENSHVDDCKIQESILLSNVYLKHLPHPVQKKIVGANSILIGLEKKGGDKS